MHSGGQPVGGATTTTTTTTTATTTTTTATTAASAGNNKAVSIPTTTASAAASASSPLKIDASPNASGTPAAAATSTGTPPGSTPKTKKRERPPGGETNGNSGETMGCKRERTLEAEEGEPSSDTIAVFLNKDGGLSTTESVEKLVVTMQQDRNEGGRKPLDVANRRTFLAGAIAATENHDCLDRFVHLGGVPLLHEWLQEAHKGKPGDADGNGKGVDELLLTIVSALEKLPVDLDALRTCLVGKSVNNLRNHKNHEIKDKAKRLVETWKKRVDEEVSSTGEIKPSPGWSTNKVVVPPGVTMSATILPVEPQQGGGVKTAASNGGGPCASKHKSKDERGSQSPSNGWGNHAVAWKDDGKNTTSPSKVNARPSGKSNPSGSQKDSAKTGGSWRAEKDPVVPEVSSHKLILRLPNPGRGSLASVTGEGLGPGSQGSSPNEQPSTSVVVDASDARQQQRSQNQPVDVAISFKAEVSREVETEKVQENRSEVSRTSPVTIVPISAASRISREAGRSTILSEIDTVNQETTLEVEVDVRSDYKHEPARKDGSGGNCASSSSFTEMSVAGQTGDAEVKARWDQNTSFAGVTEEPKPIAEQEGLGESPEPRQTRRNEDDSPKQQQQHPVEQSPPPSGEGEKRVCADVSSTQGAKAASLRRERHENDHPKSATFDCKSSSCADHESSRKTGESRRNDSAEFMIDDALEVAQQIAKEVVEEMEDREKRPAKDEGKIHRDASPVPVEADKLENADVVSPQGAEVSNVGEGQELKEEQQLKNSESEEVPVSPVKAAEDEKVEARRLDIGDDEEKQAAVPGVSRPDFDLNEGFGGEEGFKEPPVLSPAPMTHGPTTPIAVLPATKGAFVPPESLMNRKPEPGWRGSAATSAFRPAEPRRIQEAQTSGGAAPEPKPVRAPLDIDLNVSDENVTLDLGTFSSSKPKEASEGRVEFDLNCTGDGHEDGLEVKADLSTRDGSARGMTRDFDLNGPMVDDMGEEPAVMPQLNLRSSDNSIGTSCVTGFRDVVNVAPWFPQGNSFSIPTFPMGRPADSAYAVPGHQFLNGGAAAAAAAGAAGAIHFNVDLYRANGMTLATPAAYPTAPQVATYPYAGFPFAPNYSFNSSTAFPTPPGSYGDAAAAAAAAAASSYPAAASQLGGPMSRFIRPHLMGIPEGGASSAAWLRPSLDLNTGPDSEAGLEAGRTSAGGVQRGVQLEDHLRSFRQAPPPASGKRKEPEGGWEGYQSGYKQPAWC